MSAHDPLLDVIVCNSMGKFPIKVVPTGSNDGRATSDRLGFNKMVSGPPKGTKVSFTSIDAPRRDSGPVRVLLQERQ